MDDAAFKSDRGKAAWLPVDELKAFEKDRAQRAEHDRVSAERNLP
jgi:hypothetical protein